MIARINFDCTLLFALLISQQVLFAELYLDQDQFPFARLNLIALGL